MPYTPEHKHYLEAMGLVPWTLRGSSVPATAPSTGTEATVQTESVVAKNIVPAGDCSVLLVFNELSAQTEPTLAQTDKRMLLDMFAAIELSDASVAKRCVVLDPAVDTSSAIEPYLSESVKVVLVAVQDDAHASAQAIGDDEAASRLLADGLSVPVWQLPHPAWIQQEPVLKRRAWNVLKAVRRSLLTTVVV